LASLPPGCVSRQILETNMHQLGIFVHLVSLRPLCSMNAADAWEAQALRSLNKNTLEASMVGPFNRETCIRLMRALPAEEKCLSCHAAQGFKLGDVIGGLDISYTILPLQKTARNISRTAAGGFGLLWLLGIAGINLAFVHVRRRLREREQVERELQHERDFSSAVIESAGALVLVLDPQGGIVRFNRACVRTTGYSLSEVVGQKFWDLFLLPERIELVKKAFEDLKSSSLLGDYESTWVAKDGNHRLIAWANTILTDAAGMVEYVIITGIDITERKRAEAALRKSEEKFRDLFETCRDAIFIAEVSTGRLVDANEAASRLVGLPKEKIVGMHQSALHPPEEVERYKSVFSDSLNAVSGAITDVYVQHSHGERIPVEISNSFLASGDRQLIPGFFRVGTDRKRLEEERQKLERQIQHAQKLESLGVLAGGIAHDFNNLLMGVLGYADLALMELSPEAPARASVQQIETAALRAAELTKQMLAYSGKGKFVIQPLNLSKLVEEMAHLLQVSVSKKAILRYNFVENLPSIEGDATQIRQVVMNLITNASDAIGDSSGVITVGTGVMEVDQAYLREIFVDGKMKEGFYTYVEVSDTGCGMDAATRSKIFDPFFTTKFTGRGLGLAAVLGIVRGHFGGIKVYSESGRGTTFKVLFPCINQPEETLAPKATINNPWRGSGTVLIVDDEETVRAVGKMALEQAGFTVLVASDGREGVRVFGERAPEITLVLLDMTMPHMNGEEAFREMRRVRPDIRIILSSGYNEQDATNHFAGKGLAGFIQKPYRPIELIEMVASLLQGKS
jgi:PAS domain S-box-containing protein